MDFDRIIASVPVNSQAAKQMGRGEVWKPRVQLQDHYEDCPPLKSLGHAVKDPGFINFTGHVFGRLTVVGLMDKGLAAKNASWVCRCKCGHFCTRTSKSLRAAQVNGNSFVPMCGLCDYTDKIKRGWVPKGKPK